MICKYTQKIQEMNKDNIQKIARYKMTTNKSTFIYANGSQLENSEREEPIIRVMKNKFLGNKPT